MVAALITSTAFLTSYLIYHYNVGSVPFTKHGWIRPVYFLILIPHVILAIGDSAAGAAHCISGLHSRFDKHVRIARWTFPLWMYVSVTGVIVYLMLYHM